MLHFMCIFAIAGTVFLMLDLEKKKKKRKKREKKEKTKKQTKRVMFYWSVTRVIRN